MSDADQQIDHIVLGVDDGDYSWETVGAARDLAASVGAQLQGFHATVGEAPAALVDKASAIDLPLFSAGPQSGTDPSAAIVEHVAGLVNAAVALTSHARRGLTSAVLGSTAASVLGLSPDPIVLFGPHHAHGGSLTRVVACVDGSELSESILPAAVRWARAGGVPLWLVHVVEVVGAGAAEANYLKRVSRSLDTSGLDIEFDVLHGDSPGRAIGDFANAEAGALTALATHGRTGLRHATMGSVAMDVTRRAHGPTLVQRPR